MTVLFGGVRRRICQKSRMFFSDETALSTFEYILILAIAVLLAIFVIRSFIIPYSAKLAKKLGDAIKNMFFRKGNLHRIRIPK